MYFGSSYVLTAVLFSFYILIMNSKSSRITPLMADCLHEVLYSSILFSIPLDYFLMKSERVVKVWREKCNAFFKWII